VDSEMLSYGKHLSFMGILGAVSDNIDQVLIFHYIGAAELAIYNFATAIPDQIKGPIKYLSNLIFPKFSERNDEEIRAGMKSKISYLLISGIIFIVIYIFAAPYIFKIFFPKYLSSVLYSQIFSISILSIISVPANTYLSAKKKVKEKYLENILGSLAQIILVAVGVIYWGIMGLVVARVIIRLIFSFISISLYNSASQTSTN
jgi:O-antigen/teichoic acid export membrane protein